MGKQTPDKPETIISFAPAPKAAALEGNFVAEDSGRAILALMQKAADTAKEDCARAMDVAHKLSFEIRTIEERARAAESEAAHFRDRTTHAEAEAAQFRDRATRAEAEAAHFRERATRAEAWLLRIHGEVEQTFFQKNEREPRQAPSQPTFYAQPHPQDGPIIENDRAGRIENDRAGRRR
jgi:hypothetical protein